MRRGSPAVSHARCAVKAPRGGAGGGRGEAEGELMSSGPIRQRIMIRVIIIIGSKHNNDNTDKKMMIKTKIIIVTIIITIQITNSII